MKLISDLIPAVIRSLQEPDKLNRFTLTEKWPQIVGKKIAEHTRPTLSDKGNLCVWVDQSTLAFELSQKHRQTILKRTQEVLGAKTVKTVRFRVGELRA